MNYSDMRFTDLYMEYARDITDAPDVYAKWLSYLLLSCAVNKNVFMRGGIERIYPNLWFLIIGPSSTFRKSYSQKMVMRLVKAVYPEFVLYDTSSREAFFAELGREDRDAPLGTGLLAIDELAGFMKRSRESAHFRGFIQDLSSLFDGQYNPKRTGVAEETKTMLKIEEPFFNMTAACSFDWLTKSIESADISGGFWARFIWVIASEKGKAHWAEPGLEDPEKKAEILDRLRTYRGLIGQMKWKADAEALWKHWYKDFRDRFAGGPWDASYERLTTQIKKIAMLNAVQRMELEVTYTDLDEAVGMAEPIVDTLGDIVLGDTFNELTKNKILSAIKRAGPSGMSRSELLNNIKALNKKLLDDVEATLIEAERITITEESTGGRKRIVFRLRNPGEYK